MQPDLVEQEVNKMIVKLKTQPKTYKKLFKSLKNDDLETVKNNVQQFIYKVKTPPVSEEQKRWITVVAKRIPGLLAHVSVLKTNKYNNVGIFKLQTKHLPLIKNKQELKMVKMF